MKYEETNEYMYLTALVQLQDELLQMLATGELTTSQKDQLMPYINDAQEVLNKVV